MTPSFLFPLQPRTWRWRSTHLAFGAALAVWLSACGPGVGGTGIGAEPPPLSTFGAVAVSVCTSSLAPSLNCTAVGALPSAPTAPPADRGTAILVLSDTTGRILLRLDGNRVELNAPCLGLGFKGEWGQVPGQAPRFYGAIESVSSTAPGTLELGSSGSRFSVQLVDNAGRIVAGPLELSVTQAQLPASCN
jgi:hypothetical protein